MVKASEKHAEQDKKKRDSIETKNNAETLIYSTEKLLTENKDKVDKETSEKITKQIDELKEVVKSDDTEKIKKKLEEVQKVVQEIGMKIYQQAAAEQAKKEKDKKEEKKDEKVVDAEVVDEDKKGE